jgi:hypothetical protein
MKDMKKTNSFWKTLRDVSCEKAGDSDGEHEEDL